MDKRDGDEMTEFFNMGGYAAYVWSSYAIAFISLLLGIILPFRAHSAALTRLKGRFRREQIQAQEQVQEQAQEQTQAQEHSRTQEGSQTQDQNTLESTSQQEKGEAS